MEKASDDLRTDLSRSCHSFSVSGRIYCVISNDVRRGR